MSGSVANRDELVRAVESKVSPPLELGAVGWHDRQFSNVFLALGGLTIVLVLVLATYAYRSVSNDRLAILENAMDRGYWIVRSLELGHGSMRDDQSEPIREMIRELGRYDEIVSLTLLRKDGTVSFASDPALEGTRWPKDLGDPPERGRVVSSDLRTTELVYTAKFSEMFERMGHSSPHSRKLVDDARLVVLSLNTAEAYAHYRSSVTQSIVLFLLTGALLVTAIAVVAVFQRNLRLEQIKRGLQRFVPQSAQKRIEDDPEHPRLEKVESSASVLFLDIEGYTRITEKMPADKLNSLVEKYFSVFLDTIVLHRGEINETAGDGIMAIFTGISPNEHALCAVRAAIDIREHTKVLNSFREASDPELLVNIGINTGQVLIGATSIKGATGEHLTYTASGAVTNIAARLCDLSKNGEICISGATAEFVGPNIALGGRLQTNIKNLDRRISVYRVE